MDSIMQSPKTYDVFPQSNNCIQKLRENYLNVKDNGYSMEYKAKCASIFVNVEKILR